MHFKYPKCNFEFKTAIRSFANAIPDSFKKLQQQRNLTKSLKSLSFSHFRQKKTLADWTGSNFNSRRACERTQWNSRIPTKRPNLELKIWQKQPSSGSLSSGPQIFTFLREELNPTGVIITKLFSSAVTVGQNKLERLFRTRFFRVVWYIGARLEAVTLVRCSTWTCSALTRIHYTNLKNYLWKFWKNTLAFCTWR